MMGAKDRPPPGPSYMSEDQMGQQFHASPTTPSRLRECTIFEEGKEEDAHSHHTPTAGYLQNLRANKTRPVGSRPPPPSKLGSPRRAETETIGVHHVTTTASDGRPGLPQSSSMPIMPPQMMARERPKSSLGLNSPFAGRPLARPPSATPDDNEPTKSTEKPVLRRPHSAVYMEQGTRWMEKQEAKSLRMALEDMDLAEEQRVHTDAQDEAADLVWRHQNPNAPMPNPDLAYENPDLNRDYQSHLRKGSYSRTHSQEAVPQAAGRSSFSSTRPSTNPSGRPSMEGKRRVTPPVIQEEPDAKPNHRSQLRTGSSASSQDREDMPAALNIANKRASFSRPFSRPSVGTSAAAPERPPLPHAATTGDVVTRKTSGSKGKGYGDLAAAVKKDIDNARRRSSSGKRILSGDKKFYMHPNDKIYEDPQEEATPPKKSRSPAGMPIPDLRPTPSPPIQAPTFEPPAAQPATGYVRKNPFARVRMQQQMLERTQSEPVITKPAARLDRVEIQRNPPTQSRNAGYMSNESVPATPPRVSEDSGVEESAIEDTQSPGFKDGKEIRGDDIRAATSKQRKDRSTNLPQPTVVSDKPGRPIVSFQKEWKPKEIVLEEVHAAAVPATSTPPKADAVASLRFSNESPRPSSRGSVRASPFHRNSIPRFEPPMSSSYEPSKPALPAVNALHDQRAPSRPPVPTINLPGDEPAQKPPIPTICLPDDDEPMIPSIVLPEEPEFASSSSNSMPTMPTIPTIAVNDAPSISVSGPGFSTRPSPARHNTALPSTHAPAPPHRPLPTPTQHDPHLHHAHTTPLPRTMNNKSTPHYTPSLRQASALCAHCALPIAGRILSAAGQRFHPGCFICHECSTNLELVAFYPEPETERSKRLERIALRNNGGELPEDLTEDQFYALEASDGEPSLRFYCHLDFHEHFSPRCKSCKTPIEGEVIVACGAEWHAGHFFCAQCGDPFDSTTPFVEKDGYAWCVNCHTNRYSAKCKGCRKPVTDVVVKALGFEWHAGCFACVVSLFCVADKLVWIVFADFVPLGVRWRV